MDYLKACAEFSRKTQANETQDTEEREAQQRRIQEAIQALQADVCLRRVLVEMNTDEEVCAEHVFTLWETLQTHILVTPQNQGIYQHLIDSAAFASQLATLKPEIGVSPEKAAFTAILHNAGMLLGPSVEYYRKAEVSFLLAKSLGIRKDIQALMLPLDLYITPKNVEGKPKIPTTDSPDDVIILDNARYIQETITDEQLMIEMARVFAKRNSKTKKLLTWDEVLELHKKTRAGEEGYRTVIGGKKILWPNAKEALQDIAASRLAESYAEVYLRAFAMLQAAGFNHTEVAHDIDASWSDTENILEATSNALFTTQLPTEEST